jgi:2-polyprenyl-3-methyl-5-hydroxy-6-metoxy-1,4-benzoquinol methylase
MNLQEYIQSCGRTSFHKFDRTFVAAQVPKAFEVIEELIQEVKPEKILEIGTAEGGLTSFINYVGKMSNQKFKMISTDIIERPQYQDIRNEDVTLLVEDIFDWNSETVKNQLVLEFLSGPSRKIIFCDGGNKAREFRILSKYLNPGDFILAHDYIDNKENFHTNFFDKIWNWMEISESDISGACETYNLADYKKETFSNVVWVCKEKKPHKYAKEDYITTQPTSSVWANHANVGILNLYKDYVSGSVLDVGCNHGASGTYWILTNPSVTSVTGLDFQEQVKSVFLDVMRSSGTHVPYEFVTADFTKPTKFSAKYDTIVSFHVLEHIWSDDVSIFAKNIYDNLKDEAYFIISIPYKDFYDDPHHVAVYDEVSLRNIFESAGFSTIECVKDDRWPHEKNLLTAVFKK